MTQHVQPRQLIKLLQSELRSRVIDVRGKGTCAEGRLPIALHIPADKVQERLEKQRGLTGIPRDQPVVVH
jgi:hypothetical protein